MRHTFLAAIVAAVSFAVLAAPAGASQQAASGSFVEGPETITSAKFAGTNEIYKLTRDAVFTGTYQGLGQVEQRIVIHGDGSLNVHMTIAFSGLACGQPVEDLTFVVVGQGSFVDNAIEGHYVVQGGDNGSGRFTSVPGIGGSYEGMADCA